MYIGNRTYKNVDYTDYKTHLINGEKKRRLYKMNCVQCSSDRGYKVLGEANRSCLACHTKRMTKKTKQQKKIYSSMKANVNQRFKWRKINKDAGIFRFLPYSLEQLMSHLESQFEPWMNWDNHGLFSRSRKTWQIDHIVPDSYFIYLSPKDKSFNDSWALNNLRPLESMANILKSDSVEDVA